MHDFRDLICWQLCQALKLEVLQFTETGPASRDFKYRDQIRDSASASPRDIAEGFGRFRPREFARFLEYARASLMETSASIIDGHDRKYFDTPFYWRLLNLARAAQKATTGLLGQKQRQAAASKSPPRQNPRRRPAAFSITVDELIARRGRRDASS